MGVAHEGQEKRETTSDESAVNTTTTTTTSQKAPPPQYAVASHTGGHIEGLLFQTRDEAEKYYQHLGFSRAKLLVDKDMQELRWYGFPVSGALAWEQLRAWCKGRFAQAAREVEIGSRWQTSPQYTGMNKGICIVSSFDADGDVRVSFESSGNKTTIYKRKWFEDMEFVAEAPTPKPKSKSKKPTPHRSSLPTPTVQQAMTRPPSRSGEESEQPQENREDPEPKDQTFNPHDRRLGLE